MRLHELSRRARLGLTILLTAAILLPLLLIMPRYLESEIAAKSRSSSQATFDTTAP